jgi:hypothetical protein
MANVTVVIEQWAWTITFYNKDACFDDVAFSGNRNKRPNNTL